MRWSGPRKVAGGAPQARGEILRLRRAVTASRGPLNADVRRRSNAADLPVKVRYYIDPETGQPHIYKHNVSESEVEEVLSQPGEDRAGADNSRVAIGRTLAGRLLKVTYVPDLEPKSVFVITAYELRGKPALAYRRRRRKLSP